MQFFSSMRGRQNEPERRERQRRSESPSSLSSSERRREQRKPAHVEESTDQALKQEQVSGRIENRGRREEDPFERMQKEDEGREYRGGGQRSYGAERDIERKEGRYGSRKPRYEEERRVEERFERHEGPLEPVPQSDAQRRLSQYATGKGERREYSRPGGEYGRREERYSRREEEYGRRESQRRRSPHMEEREVERGRERSGYKEEASPGQIGMEATRRQRSQDEMDKRDIAHVRAENDRLRRENERLAETVENMRTDNSKAAGAVTEARQWRDLAAIANQEKDEEQVMRRRLEKRADQLQLRLMDALSDLDKAKQELRATRQQRDELVRQGGSGTRVHHGGRVESFHEPHRRHHSSESHERHHQVMHGPYGEHRYHRHEHKHETHGGGHRHHEYEYSREYRTSGHQGREGWLSRHLRRH
ncbi:MAG: hypothetical protein MHM6MM_001233 [Cercozoa sp. M6MM]